MCIPEECRLIGRAARAASRAVAKAGAEQKNDALKHMAEFLGAHRAALQSENQKDLDAGREAGLSSASILDQHSLRRGSSMPVSSSSAIVTTPGPYPAWDRSKASHHQSRFWPGELIYLALLNEKGCIGDCSGYAIVSSLDGLGNCGQGRPSWSTLPIAL